MREYVLIHHQNSMHVHDSGPNTIQLSSDESAYCSPTVRKQMFPDTEEASTEVAPQPQDVAHAL